MLLMTDAIYIDSTTIGSSEPETMEIVATYDPLPLTESLMHLVICSTAIFTITPPRRATSGTPPSPRQRPRTR